MASRSAQVSARAPWRGVVDMGVVASGTAAGEEDRRTSLLGEDFDDEAEKEFLSHAEETRVLRSFGEGSATGREWASAVTATILLSLCSLVGILLFSNSSLAKKISLPLAFMLSSGALLTTALVHIIPEAIQGLEGEGNFRAMSTRGGITLFAGMSVGLILHVALGAGHSHPHGMSNASTTVRDVQTVNGDGMTNGSLGNTGGEIPGVEIGAPSSSAWQDCTIVEQDEEMPGLKSLDDARRAGKGRQLLDIQGLSPACWNAILGDLTHNFADGVTIGAAFMGCSSTVGWTVTAASMLHEIPHELANFMVLVNGGMSVTQALFYNFLSAMFSILGAILVLALKDQFTQAGISLVLLFGAGTFVFVGLAELIPDALADSESTTGIKSSQRGGQRKVLAFFMGALILGLPLLVRSDCEFE